MALSQLALDFTVHNRFVIPVSRTTWREGDVVKVDERGEHSIDCEWPWILHPAVGAVDPHAGSTGNPPTRDENSSSSSHGSVAQTERAS